MPATARKPPGAAALARAAPQPEVADLSDLLPAEIDHLVEETLRHLPTAPVEQREAHFLRLVEGYRGRRDQPPGGGVPTVDYTKKFYDAVNAGPQRWGEFVEAPAHETAQRLVRAGVDSGYLDHVRIAGDDYLRHLTGSGKRILYHFYAQHPEHGAELLQNLKQSGVDCPYDVAQCATLAQARPDHLREPAIESDGQHARALTHAIAFQPRGPEEATRLLDAMAKAGSVEKVKRLSKDAAPEVPGRWQQPMIHAGIPHESLRERVANTLPAGGQHVLVLDDVPLQGFRAHPIFEHAPTRTVKKGLSIQVLTNPLPVRPLVALIGFPEDRAARRLVTVDGDRLRSAPPPLDWQLPGELVGRAGLALKGVAVLGRLDEVDTVGQAQLAAYLQVLGRVLGAVAAVHAVPSLADYTLMVGPRRWSTAKALAVSPADVGALAGCLRLPGPALLRACPTAAARYGADLPAVAYDYVVAERAGWPRDTLDPTEAARLRPVLLEALARYGRTPHVALVIR